MQSHLEPELACFLFDIIRMGQTKHPDLLRWRDFSERNGKGVGAVAYANYHLFILGDKLLIHGMFGLD